MLIEHNVTVLNLLKFSFQTLHTMSITTVQQNSSVVRFELGLVEHQEV